MSWSYEDDDPERDGDEDLNFTAVQLVGWLTKLSVLIYVFTLIPTMARWVWSFLWAVVPH